MLSYMSAYSQQNTVISKVNVKIVESEIFLELLGP